jgi:hypothetical protein
MIGDWAPEPRQGLPSWRYNNKTLIQWINHLFVRCYKLKFLKCVMSPRSKSLCSRQMLACTLQNAIQTAWMDCTVTYTVGITVMYSGIHFVQIVRTGGMCKKRTYNSAAQINLQYLCLKQNLRLPVFPLS